MVYQSKTNKSRKDRPAKLSKQQQQKFKDCVESQAGVSQRKMAAKFKVSSSCIRHNLNKMGLKYYKRRRAPKYTSKQLEEMPGTCRKLTDSETFIIMDDEKHFSFSGDNMPSNVGFGSCERERTSSKVKFKSKRKFARKILVWLAVFSKDISALHMETTKGSAINDDVYVKKCLPKLLRFINKHHQGDKYLFWPDLASSHYAKKAMEWLDEHNIPFVHRAANPPNVPQARPIENFWSRLADKVYNGGWEATNSQQLVNRIKRKVKQVDLKAVQTMMNDVRINYEKLKTVDLLRYCKYGILFLLYLCIFLKEIKK